jgi:RNA polymerase sigma-70 factor (ECF subfamily)
VADTILHLDERAGLKKTGAEVSRSQTREDRRLLEGLKEGTAEAYESLITIYQQPIYNLVCRLVGDGGDACDVVQEVFVKVFRKVGGFRGDSSLKTWLYRIAVNEAYNHQRWRSRHSRQEVSLEGDEEGGLAYARRLSDPGRSPFDCAADHERRLMIEAALSGLGASFRAAVVLRDIDDLSYEEIAEVLRVPLGTVKSRILRGREALRKELAGRLEPAPALSLTPQPAE